MKARKWVWGVFITALVVTVILISLESLYVAVALVLGVVIILHRELWALLRKQKLPPADERVRENVTKAIRNSFIFFAVATALMMLPFGLDLLGKPGTLDVLSVLFLSVGLVYMLSYTYYDRAEPKMSAKLQGLLRVFLLTAGLSLGAAVISIFIHNVVGRLLAVEEPVFFIIGVIVAPLGVVVGLLGSLVVYIMGLTDRAC